MTTHWGISTTQQLRKFRFNKLNSPLQNILNIRNGIEKDREGTEDTKRNFSIKYSNDYFYSPAINF